MEMAKGGVRETALKRTRWRRQAAVEQTLSNIGETELAINDGLTYIVSLDNGVVTPCNAFGALARCRAGFRWYDHARKGSDLSRAEFLARLDADAFVAKALTSPMFYEMCRQEQLQIEDERADKRQRLMDLANNNPGVNVPPPQSAGHFGYGENVSEDFVHYVCETNGWECPCEQDMYGRHT